MAKAKKTKRESNRIALRGKAKFFHKLARFILFPVFHPIWTLFILIALWLPPTFMGVKPASVHNWYAEKVKNFFVEDLFTPVAKNVMPKITIKTASIPGVEKIVEPKKQEEYNINDRRKMFLKLQSQSKVVDFSQDINNKNKDNNLGLNYLQKPEVITGKAVAIDANQIAVGGKFIYLHGIYVDPASELGRKAEDFLNDMFFGKEIACKVVAYSKQGAATGFCNVDGVNINNILIKKNYSKEVLIGE